MNTGGWTRVIRAPVSRDRQGGDNSRTPPADAGRGPAIRDVRDPVRLDDARELRTRSPIGCPTDCPRIRSRLSTAHGCSGVGARRRSCAISSARSGRHSLVFFYTKEGQPISDSISRLIVGVGRVNEARARRSSTRASEARRSLRSGSDLVHHSIRAGRGRRLPSARTTPTSSRRAIRKRTRAGATSCARSPSRQTERTCDVLVLLRTRVRDVALSTLVRCLDAVRKDPAARNRRGTVGGARGVAQRADRADLD